MVRSLALVLLVLAPAGASAVEGELIVLNKSGASASILDLGSGEELVRLEVGVGPHEVAVSPDGSTAVVANYGDRNPGNTLSVLSSIVERSVRRSSSARTVAPTGFCSSTRPESSSRPRTRRSCSRST